MTTVWGDLTYPTIDGPRHPILDLERGRYLDTMLIVIDMSKHAMDRWRVQDTGGADQYQINITRHFPTAQLGYHISIGYKFRHEQDDPTDDEDVLAEEVFRQLGVPYITFGRMGPNSNAANYVENLWRKS
ncbi:MAG: hypothetical protein IH969_02090 [Candidatus Krumholzibacteriota bacterium]|nr:hypothetical protein [Candidatus Krumholzibacteriota bacterium]